MPYTVHTPDGQAHTYPDTTTLIVEDDVRVYDHAEIAPGPYPIQLTPAPIAAYPAGQWTHYHVEPAPYETDYDAKQAAREEEVDRAFAEAMDKKRAQQAWARQFQSDIDAGRKAAEAQ